MKPKLLAAYPDLKDFSLTTFGEIVAISPRKKIQKVLGTYLMWKLDLTVPKYQKRNRNCLKNASSCGREHKFRTGKES